MDINHLLQASKEYRKSKKYESLSKEGSKIVKYLLLEVEEMDRDGKMAISRRQQTVRLFEIRFSRFEPVKVSSIYKFGAAKIKCFSDCKGELVEQVIEEIEDVCEILNWQVNLKVLKGKFVSGEMNISLDIRKEETP